MKNVITRQKSRNDLTIGQPSDQQTALPSSLHEIKSISKELFRLTKNDLENLNSDFQIGTFVKLLNSVREEVTKKFDNSKYLNKIEEIFDNNFESLLNYFIECSETARKIKLSISNNLNNGLESIERIATELSYDLFAKEKINSIKELNFNFIFDEEFVNLINSLSSGIKDFMKNCTSNTKNANINSDQIIDNIGSSKLIIQELIQQLNFYSKNLNPINIKTNNNDNLKAYNTTAYSNVEKNLREKLIPLIEKLDEITEQRIFLSKHLKNIEIFSSKFYEEAKGTFKNLKNLHSQKLSELQKYNNDLFEEKANTDNNNRNMYKNINGYSINNCHENKDNNKSNNNFNNNNYDRFIVEEQEPVPQELNIQNKQNIKNENNTFYNPDMEIALENAQELDEFSHLIKNMKKNQKIANNNNLVNKIKQNLDCNSYNKNNLSNNNSQNNPNVKIALNSNSNNAASNKLLNQKKMGNSKTSTKEFNSISPLNKRLNTNNFIQNNQQSLNLNTTDNCLNNSILITKNNNLIIPNSYLNNNNNLIDYNYHNNNVNINNDINKNQENLNKHPKLNLIKQPFLNNVDSFSRSNSNPRTCKNIKNGRLSKLENLNMLSNQSNLNINFRNVQNTPTNKPNYLSNKSKPTSQINYDISSFEHFNKLSKMNLNRQNRNKNSHSLSLNHQYYNKSIGYPYLEKNNNHIIIKNLSNSVDDNEVLNNKKSKMADIQNMPLLNKTVYELSLKNNELNEELNKLHESYNILESENIKLKQLNDKVSKFSIINRSSSNNWKEKSSGLSKTNKFSNNINIEEIHYKNYSNFNKVQNQGYELKHINDFNDENNEIYNYANEFTNQQIIYNNDNNLIKGENTNTNLNTSKSVEIYKQKSFQNTQNKINNKNYLNKIRGNNSIDLNHIVNNNHNLRESNLILNSNLNSKSSNSTKFNIFSFMILSEKVINFIRILNNFLEEIDRKSSISQINEIRDILNNNKQELIQLANDFLVKSKTLVDENNINFISQNAQDLNISHTPTHNLKYNKSSKNIHNISIPYENKCASDLSINIPGKKPAINNSKILEIKSNGNNKSIINNINSNVKLEKNKEPSQNYKNCISTHPSNDNNNVNIYKKKPAEILKEFPNLQKSGSKSNLRSNKIINSYNPNQSSNFKMQYMNASNVNNFSNIAANEVSNENHLNTTSNNTKHFGGAISNNTNNLYNLYLSNLNKLNNNNINTCKNSNVKSIYNSFKMQKNNKTMGNKSLGKLKNKNNYSSNNPNYNNNFDSNFNKNDNSANYLKDIMFNENTEIDFRNSDKNLILIFDKNKKDQSNDPNIKSRSSNLLDNDSNLINSNGNITDEENPFNRSKKHKNIITNILDSDIESDTPFNSTMKVQANKNPYDSKANSKIISLQNSDNGVHKINSLLEKKLSSQNSANNNSTSNLSNLNRIAIISNTNLNLNDFENLNSFTINQRGNYLKDLSNINNNFNNYNTSNNLNSNSKNNISLQMLKNNYIKNNFNNFCNNNFSTENNILTNFESCENQKSEQNIINTNTNTNSNPNFNSSNFINSINIINNTDKNNDEDYNNKNKVMNSNLKIKNALNNNNYVLDIKDLNSNPDEKLQIKLLDSKKYLNEYYKLNRKTQENYNLSDNDNTDNDIKKTEENFELENPITEKKAKHNFNENNINYKPTSLDDHEYLTAIRLNLNLQETNEKLNKEIEILKKLNLDLISEIELNKKKFEEIKENENFKEEYEAFKLKKENENNNCEQFKMQVEINQLKTENEKLFKELIDIKNNRAIEEKINCCDNCKILEKNSNANLMILEDLKKELNKLNKTIKEKEKQIKNYQIEIDKINLVSDQKEMLINKLNKKIRLIQRNEKSFNLEQSNEIPITLIETGIDNSNNAINPILKQNSFNSNVTEVSDLLRKIEEFDKQANAQKNTINELNIKLKVNKNERDSLFAEIEKLKKQLNELNIKNEVNEQNNISSNNNSKYSKTEESDKNFKFNLSGKIENLNTIKNLDIENQNLQLKLQNLSEMKTLISKLEDENSNLLQQLSLKQSDFENSENILVKLKVENTENKKENETLIGRIKSLEKNEVEKAKIYEEKLDHLQKKFKMISVDNENLKNQNFNIKNEFEIYMNENTKKIENFENTIKSLKINENEKLNEINSLNENLKTLNSNLTRVSKEKEDFQNQLKRRQTETIETIKQDVEIEALQKLEKQEILELFEFLENFNNSIIDEIEIIYYIFYEINPKDYKISNFNKLNLNLKNTFNLSNEIPKNNSSLIKADKSLKNIKSSSSQVYKKITKAIISAFSENITSSIKQISSEIEEFKNYYLKNFNFIEENSSNVLHVIPEENPRSSQDHILSPNSLNNQASNNRNYEKILGEKENEIINLKEKYELLEITYNELYENHELKIKDLSDIIENLEREKKNGFYEDLCLEKKININKNKKNNKEINKDSTDSNNYDNKEEIDLNLENIQIKIDTNIADKNSLEKMSKQETKNKSLEKEKKLFFENNISPDNHLPINTNLENKEGEEYKKKFFELTEEYRKLKKIFDECTQIIYDAIKIYKPNILEDENISFQISPSGKLQKDPNLNIYNALMDSKGSQISAGSHHSNISVFSDKEFISKAVEIFKQYNQEINENNKKLEFDLQEAESKIQLYKISSEEYKKALNLSLKNSCFINEKIDIKIDNEENNDPLILERNEINNYFNFELKSLGENINSRNHFKEKKFRDNINEIVYHTENRIDNNNDPYLFKEKKPLEGNLTGSFGKFLNAHQDENDIEKANLDAKNNNDCYKQKILNPNEIKLINDLSEETHGDRNLTFFKDVNCDDEEKICENKINKNNYKEKILIEENQRINKELIHSNDNYNIVVKEKHLKKKILNTEASKSQLALDIMNDDYNLTENNTKKISRNKLRSICNFTVEDLIEPENSTFLNNNPCDENSTDNENICVNTKILEKFNKPERYKIVAKKTIKNNFSWYLLADKLTDLDFFSYETLLWIPAKTIENKLSLYELDKSTELEEKSSSNSNNTIITRSKPNYKCITCHKKSNSRKKIGFDININTFNEKEFNNSNQNSNNLNNNSHKENISNHNIHKGSNNEGSSFRNFDNFENFEFYDEDLENDENSHRNSSLLKDIKFNTTIREKNLEIEKLNKNEKDLNRKLKEKKLIIKELKQVNDMLFKTNNESLNTNNSSKNVSLEKYEILFSQYKKELEKRKDMIKKYDEIKSELELINKKADNYKETKGEKKIEEKNSQKVLSNSDIKLKPVKEKSENKNLFKDNNFSIELEKESFKNLLSSKYQSEKIYNLKIDNNSDLIDVNFCKNNTAYPVCNTFSGINNLNFTLNSSMNIESVTREKNNATEGAFINETIKEVVIDYEKNEKLLVDQLNGIKDELKQTRLERDNYKKKYSEALTLHTGERKEICDMLKSALEKLISEIQLTPKIKELLTVILRIIDFSEEEINNIFKEKDNKKKNFFNFISRK